VAPTVSCLAKCMYPVERDHLEDLGVDVIIILKWISQRWVGGHGVDCSGSGEGQVGAFECVN